MMGSIIQVSDSLHSVKVSVLDIMWAPVNVGFLDSEFSLGIKEPKHGYLRISFVYQCGNSVQLNGKNSIMADFFNTLLVV